MITPGYAELIIVVSILGLAGGVMLLLLPTFVLKRFLMPRKNLGVIIEEYIFCFGIFPLAGTVISYLLLSNISRTSLSNTGSVLFNPSVSLIINALAYFFGGLLAINVTNQRLQKLSINLITLSCFLSTVPLSVAFMIGYWNK